MAYYSIATAQINYDIGARTGLTFSNYQLTLPVTPLKMRTSGVFQIYNKLEFSKGIFFEQGFQISGRGAIIPEIVGDSAIFLERKILTTHLDLPFMLGISPSENFFDIKIGIQFSNLQSAYLRDSEESQKFDEFFNDWSTGFVLELTQEFDFGLNVTARYLTSFSAINRDPQLFAPNVPFVDEWRTSSFQILVGYNLNLIKGIY
jgi:hypothetical protein